MARYRLKKSENVNAERMRYAGELRPEGKPPIAFAAGDYIVTDDAGNMTIVKGATFDELYQEVKRVRT